MEEELVPDQAENRSRDDRPAAAISTVKSPQRGDVERFQIPLLKGKIGVVELPKGWNESDVKKMIRVMNAMFFWSEEATK